EVAVGDLKEPATLPAALLGVSCVVTTANSAGRAPPDTPETVDLRGNIALVDAAKAAHVRHFVFLSALGADPKSPVPFLAAKGGTDAHLARSGLRWTSIQPTMFSEVWPAMIVGMPVQTGQPVTIIGEGRKRHAFISAADVAAFCTAAVDNPAAFDRVILLGGPQALTWRDVVGVFEKVAGRNIETRFVPHGSKLPGLPDVVSALATGTDLYESAVPMDETARTFGVELTPLEDVVRGLLTKA
ncbi:MAG TPA: NAD(P)H-binding protein, partial [Candidatus Thermoplasmatota archaeon]|nr:NAD(P)H-binding protein [Candidatus Thermoplasmatota archaeon]